MKHRAVEQNRDCKAGNQYRDRKGAGLADGNDPMTQSRSMSMSFENCHVFWTCSRRASLTAQLMLGYVCVFAFFTPSCRKEQPKPEPAADVPAKIEPTVPKEIPTHIEIPVPIDDPNRWLFVEKVADGAKGGWATGSFDEERNKLSITTSDVTEFALDTSLIKINWRKLVILSIDGRNSELRQRDFDILHFRRSTHGEWSVKEP